MTRKLILSFLVVVALGAVALFLINRRIDQERAKEYQAALAIKKKDITITIVEGKRREEIAKLLATAEICDYDAFLKASQNYEGMLFPDTYRFFTNTSADEVVAKLRTNFLKKTLDLNLTSQQLILASIVEREAVTDDERPLIAGVYTNRLTIGMKLDADPTVQFAKDSLAYTRSSAPETITFWGQITRDDYTQVISNYNTYLNTGLPPGPISNPGLKSILAAQKPSKHEYFYFLHKDKKLLLSKTFAEHQRKQ